MTKTITIMTIDIQVTKTMDVSKENETFNLADFKYDKLAAISWVSKSNERKKIQTSILKTIFSTILESNSKYKFWFIICDSVWQNDTRIIRYKKLWKSLNDKNIEISHSNKSFEKLIEFKGKLKYFGAKDFFELSIPSVVTAVTSEPCAYIVALPDTVNVNETLPSGWNDCSRIDERLLKYCLNNRGFLFKSLGEFDDIESGFVGFGSPKLITALKE